MLYDFNFLRQLDENRHKTIYARIIALQLDETPVETIEGRVTQGSINLDGDSAVRRTCSLTIVAKNYDYNNYLWGLNTKFKLYTGLKKLSNGILNGEKFQTMTPIDGVMYGGPANGPLMIDITAEDITRLGIEYVIGGVHKPNYTEQTIPDMIDDFFNQSCYLLNHELVDILAHPWDGLPFWSGYSIVSKNPADRHPEAFLQIPQEYWDELAHLLTANNKLAELNCCNLFFEDKKIAHFLMEKMTEWKEKGVKFTFGSDIHSPDYPETDDVSDLLTEYGFTEEDFGLPPHLC